MSPSSEQQQQQQHRSSSSTITTNNNNNTFGGPDAALAARLQAPVSPTTANSPAANEARRRTSEWKPSLPGRQFSFDREEHKHAMMTASGALAPGGAAGSEGFSERA